MVDGVTQNIQGFLSDNPATIMKRTTPHRYCLNVEYALTKVICSAVSADIVVEEGAHHG